MKFDLFQSICQSEVEGHLPSEKHMFKNFFRQVILADQLGFDCAWVAESHLSSQIQKQNPGAVIPDFRGEIGLNTDILQLAHQIFSKTKRINVGSAIRNIMANGGPIAHAEAVRMFMTLHCLDSTESRRLELGFASGRFPYSNRPYGVRPRNEFEEKAWPVLKGLVLQEAVEVFLRFLRGDVFSSLEVRPKLLHALQFRNPEQWQNVLALANSAMRGTESGVHEMSRVNPTVISIAGETQIQVPSFWQFEKVGVVPKDAPLELLRLTIGAHDAETQKLANRYMPVGVFNLSITSSEVIEATHLRMAKDYNPQGGAWHRGLMPRTVQIFIDNDRARAKAMAENANAAFWKAMDGTVDPQKLAQAVGNSLYGEPNEIREQIRERFHPEDRLMLWFDFNNHNSEVVENGMRLFAERVAPHLA